VDGIEDLSAAGNHGRRAGGQFCALTDDVPPPGGMELHAAWRMVTKYCSFLCTERLPIT